MSKLSDKEKVLEYLLRRKRDGNGEFLLSTKSYTEVAGISPEGFIEQLRVMKHETLLTYSFNGAVGASSSCYITILPPALTYFEDKKAQKKKAFWNPIKLTVRDIMLLVIGAIFSIASSVISAVVVYNLLQK